MEEMSTVGIDIAKSVFQVHGIDAAGEIVVRRQLKRRQVLPFFAALRPCLIGMEACATAHHWARELIKLGHEVRLMLRGEWFDAPLYEERWGTIIAHQSVSLHFQSAHYGSASRADEYARLYMRILRALRPGGQFLYAPRVPFFEPALGGLGGRFLVSHRSPFQGAESTAVTKIPVGQRSLK